MIAMGLGYGEGECFKLRNAMDQTLRVVQKLFSRNLELCLFKGGRLMRSDGGSAEVGVINADNWLVAGGRLEC